jgi:BNR/Asp-box repeat
MSLSSGKDRSMHSYKRAALLALSGLGTATLIVALVFGFHSTSHADSPLPQPLTHQHFNFMRAIAESGDGAVSSANYRNPSSPICATTTSTAANVNTDCEGTAPHNETAIAVDPTNTQHMLSSNNDYELAVSSGGQTNETAYSRAHVTFDGGKTWTTYPISYNSYAATGDPGVAFDADGTAYLSTLGFVWSQGNGSETNADVLVAHSTDGGKTWSSPSRVAAGSGSLTSVGIFNDKEAITAWGHGNAIVTWTVFNDGQGGSYISSPIYASVTHDGGNTWSTGVAISGSAPFCVGAQGGTACDQDQGSVPVVAADGSIYVSFLSTADATTGRDQYLVVKVDPATGARIGGPYKVANLIDGPNDFAISAFGDTTYQDSQFRTWSFGNIAADPTNASHLAVVWSDMRDGPATSSNPYATTTNSDIVLSQSFDGGATWSAAAAIQKPGDQFMPWSAYDSSGHLRISYFDRSYDPANHKYGYTLATETKPGTLKFSFTQLTTTLSDPTQGDRWFSSNTANASFPHPTTFLGDYSGIAAVPGGGSVSLWTDMRTSVCFTVRCGTGEDAYFAAAG